MKRFKTFLVLSIFLILCSTVWADIPNLINFQGILDSSGNPLANKTKSVEFKIYAVPAGGTVFWSETQSVTTNAGGVFNVLLGFSNPIPDSVFDDTVRYLGINVGTDGEMNPRQQIVSNAYGYRVSTVDGATGGTIFGNTSIQSDLYVNGNVGIGTLNPTAPLHISTTGNYLGNFLTTGTGDLIFNAVPGNSGRLVFNSNNLNSPIAFSIGNTELMRVAPNGNAGMGTTSPTEKLSISGGNVGVSGGGVLIEGGRGIYWPNNCITGGANLEIQSAGAMVLRTGGTCAGTARIVVDGTNGNVGTGTTSPP